MPALIVLLAVLAAATVHASARDLDGRYANSPLKPWFDTLASKKGLRCSDADGTALSDVDWKPRMAATASGSKVIGTMCPTMPL